MSARPHTAPTRSPSLSDVRRRMASAVVGHVDASLGELTLLPHQRDAVDRIQHALHDLHVALLADDVGLGKTFVALAVARRYGHVCIMAPAALLPMWKHAIARAQLRNIDLRSIQSFSRTPSAAFGVARGKRATEPLQGDGLVIIDEAHHVRTPSTRRYRAIAERVVGCDLLLMSATPLHNTPRDLAAPLALILGDQATRLSPALLARVVVRRTHDGGRPSVLAHAPIVIPSDRAVLDAILALPSPLPAHDGAVAGALIRLGLLRAWCSSDGALSHALRMRVLRAEALQHALQAGRHPTTAELRSWLVGDHEVQLAFPELMAAHLAESAPLLELVQRHLDAVRELLRHHRRVATRAVHGVERRVEHRVEQPSANAESVAANANALLAIDADAERVRALKAIMAAHPGTPVVAFSQFAATVRTVGRALSDIAGVGVLTGRRATIASGTVSRGDALAAFAPRAQERPPPPAHQRLMLLLTTDLLAEGVNLQDASVVVHLDLPWTDALRRQRVGRCVRVGSLHDIVHVYTFAPPDGADAVLRLDARLRRKAGLSARLVGHVDAQRGSRTAARTGARTGARTAARTAAQTGAPTGAPTGARANRRAPASAADVASAVRAELIAWRDATHEANELGLDSENIEWTTTIDAIHTGFLAAVSLSTVAPAHTILVGGRYRRSADGVMRWHLSTSPRRLWPLVRLASPASAAQHDTQHDPQHDAPHDAPHHLASNGQRTRVHRAIRRWMARRALDVALRERPSIDSPTHRRVRAALEATIARCLPAERSRLAAAHAAASDMLSSARGVAVEAALNSWLAERQSVDSAAWLESWRGFTVLRAAATPRRDDTDGEHRASIVALLLFSPGRR